MLELPEYTGTFLKVYLFLGIPLQESLLFDILGMYSGMLAQLLHGHLDLYVCKSLLEIYTIILIIHTQLQRYSSIPKEIIEVDYIDNIPISYTRTSNLQINHID